MGTQRGFATRSGLVLGAYPKGRGTQGPCAALQRLPARAVRAARYALLRALGHPGAGAWDGLSHSQPWSGYDFDTLSDDLATVIQQTGVHEATLVGYSMGGGEVARYLSRHAGRSVRKVVLVASVLPCMLKSASNPLGTELADFDAMATQLRADRAQFFAGFFKDFFGVGLLSQPVSTELMAWACGQALQAGLRATLECVRAFATTDFRPELPAFQVPTLIIHGTEDKTVPIDASSRAAAKGIKHSTLVEYDGAPHGLFATHKRRLTQDLIDFLGR